MTVYRLVNSKYDPIQVGARLTRPSNRSNQKFGAGMYFALTREDALNFAKGQHGHKYTHLITCNIENATPEDFVDLRENENVMVNGDLGQLSPKKRAPAYCKLFNKKGLIWESVAGKSTTAWTELCLYPQHIANGVLITAAEDLNGVK